jgi:hypothetical protein
MKKIYIQFILVKTIYLLSIYPAFSKVVEKESFGGMETRVLDINKILRGNTISQV